MKVSSSCIIFLITVSSFLLHDGAEAQTVLNQEAEEGGKDKKVKKMKKPKKGKKDPGTIGLALHGGGTALLEWSQEASCVVFR
mmetsp:Transcript_3005/g.4382  ORF Transcript_3005/g.4382 Transcript_3005/m.4382 type:complete len:83 (+) Transcript_3005:331-579(+)